MNIKKEIKRSLKDYFTLPFRGLAILFEKMGLRCKKCGAWGRRKTCFGSIIEELAPSPKRWYRMRVCYCPKCKSPSKAIKVYVSEHVEGMP